MYPHCTVRIRLLYAFNKYFDFDFEDDIPVILVINFNTWSHKEEFSAPYLGNHNGHHYGSREHGKCLFVVTGVLL